MEGIKMKRYLFFLFIIISLFSVPLCRAQTTGQWNLIDTKRDIVADKSYSPAEWKGGSNTSVAAYKRWRPLNADTDSIISSSFEWQGIPGSFKPDEPISVRVLLTQLVNTRTGIDSWIKIYYGEVGGVEKDGPDVLLGWREGGQSRTAEGIIKVGIGNDNPLRIRVHCSVGHDIYDILYYYKYSKGTSIKSGDKVKPVRQIVTNFNGGGVSNSPSLPEVSFELTSTYEITQITTYHWNNGQGMVPGKVALKDSKGKVLGRWSAKARSGQGEAPNVFWDVFPNLVLQPGVYTIVDSSHATWSWNTETGGGGMFQILGR
jgi:hypothetical protein